jgi:hypothetical protein
MSQIVLPLSPAAAPRGSSSAAPTRTSPRRSRARDLAVPHRGAARPAALGQVAARALVRENGGEAIDDAHRLDETELFHRWNRAQEAGIPLLIVGGEPPWDHRAARLALAPQAPRSSWKSAFPTTRWPRDCCMLGRAARTPARRRGRCLPRAQSGPLVGPISRSCVAAIDRLSLERKVPATQSNMARRARGGSRTEEPRLL